MLFSLHFKITNEFDDLFIYLSTSWVSSLLNYLYSLFIFLLVLGVANIFSSSFICQIYFGCALSGKKNTLLWCNQSSPFLVLLTDAFERYLRSFLPTLGNTYILLNCFLLILFLSFIGSILNHLEINISLLIKQGSGFIFLYIPNRFSYHHLLNSLRLTMLESNAIYWFQGSCLPFSMRSHITQEI